MSSANSFSMEECKIYLLGKGQPITRRQIVDSSKLKEFADDNFKFDENGRKLSKRVENTRYEQFLLFQHCFQKACFPGASKGVIVWEWVNHLPQYHYSFHDPEAESTSNCWKRRKYAGIYFSSFPTVF